MSNRFPKAMRNSRKKEKENSFYYFGIPSDEDLKDVHPDDREGLKEALAQSKASFDEFKEIVARKLPPELNIDPDRAAQAILELRFKEMFS